MLWLALLSGAFGLALSAQINFLVPLRARDLGASFDVIGLIVGAGAFAPAVLSVPLGSVVDRLGPRNAFVLGTGTAAAIAATFVFVTSFWWFLLLQPVLGLARSLGWIASQGYITEVAGPQERAKLTGRFSFMSNAGKTASPVMIGAVAQLLGFRWAFLVVAGYCALFAFVGVLLANTRSSEERAATSRGGGVGLRAAWELVAVRGIQAIMVLSFVRLWVNWVYQTFIPVYLVDQGLEPGIVGTVVATTGLVATLVGLSTGTLTRMATPFAVTLVALGCAVSGLFLAPHLVTLPWVFLAPPLLGVGQGLSLPLLISMISAAAPADKQGIAHGLRAMVNEGAATAAPVSLGPVIAALGMVLGFTMGGVAAGALLGVSWALFVSGRKHEETSERL